MSEKYVFQNDMFDCGVAALKTIFLQFGKKINVENSHINQGLNAYEIIKISQKNGLFAKGVKTDLSHITQKYLPCIAHIIKDKSYFHYIVIIKNNRKSKKITIFDPAEGLKNLSYEEFEKISTSIFIIFETKKFKKNFDNRFRKTIIELFKKNIKLITKCVLFSLITIFLSLLFSFYLKFLIQYEKYLVKISLLFLLLSIIKNLTFYFKNKLIIKLNERIDNDITENLITHIFNLPYNYYQMRTTGYLLNIINDLENFKSIVTKIFIIFFVDLVFVLLIILFLIWFNVYYLIIIILVAVLKITIAFLFQNKFNDNYLKIKSNKISSNTYLINYLENINSIKNLGIEEKISKNVKQKEQKCLYEKQMFNKSNNKYSFINTLLEEIFLIFVIALTFIIKFDDFTLLNLIVFTNIYQLFINFINNICEVIIMYKTYLSSITKVLDVFEEQEEKKSNENTHYNTIEYNNVSYNVENRILFDKISFKIVKNDYVFIEGKSGVGKTTLVKLLLKCICGYTGKITLDNIDLSYINENDIKKNIVYVSNNEKLFNDTIYNNLSIVNSSKDKIAKVLEVCKIEEFMKRKQISKQIINSILF